MDVLYFKMPGGNFGDDLNDELWREVLPADVWAVDDVLLVGVGTILNAQRMNDATLGSKRVFVLGSGAGYGGLPDPAILARTTFLAVRGPLTAEAVGRPEAAVTDAAALLRTLPAPPVTKVAGRIAYIPHVSSLETGLWAQACERAGLAFIDPRAAPSAVAAAIRRSELVVTEAMHGAILSDTYRVPWIPVTTSPRILDFKWLDWTRSLELPYAPLKLPPSSAFDGVQELRRALGRARRKSKLVSVPSKGEGGQAGGGRRAYWDKAARLSAPIDPVFIDRAARALASAARSRPQLSGEAVLDERVGRLRGAIDRLQRELLGVAA